MAKGIVRVTREIPPLPVYVPCVPVPIMADVGRSREIEFGIPTCRIGGRHPLVVGLMEVGTVEPRRARVEVIGIGREAHFDLPRRAVDVLGGGDEAAHAFVPIGHDAPVHRCSSCRRMPHDAEVEFNSTGAPGAPHGDVAEFDGVVEVEELAARLLVDGAPDLAADLGEHGHLHAAVLEDD